MTKLTYKDCVTAINFLKKNPKLHRQWSKYDDDGRMCLMGACIVAYYSRQNNKRISRKMAQTVNNLDHNPIPTNNGAIFYQYWGIYAEQNKIYVDSLVQLNDTYRGGKTRLFKIASDYFKWLKKRKLIA